MSLLKISLDFVDATLTDMAEFPADGILPTRLTPGSAMDVRIDSWADNLFGAFIDPDNAHVWIADLTDQRKYRLSDNTLIYTHSPGENFRGGFSTYGADTLYVVGVTNLWAITISTETPVSLGVVTHGGNSLWAITREPTGNLAWGLFADGVVRQFDITGALNPITELQAVPYSPFNASFGSITYAQLENDGTYLYVKGRYSVHRWRIADGVHMGTIPEYTRAIDDDAEREISGIALDGSNNVRVLRSLDNLTEGYARGGLWTPMNPATTTDFVATDLPAAIPDNSPPGVISSIPVTGLGTVDGLMVSIEITHTYISDLRINVIHPDSTELRIWGRQGGGFNDIDLLLADISWAFRGKPANGTWQIRVSDGAGGDTGTFDTATLHFGADGHDDDVRELTANSQSANRFIPGSHIRAGLEAFCYDIISDPPEYCRVIGNIAGLTTSDAQWSYASPGARMLKGIVLAGDLSRESNTTTATRKTLISYFVGTVAPGAGDWVEVVPGADLSVVVAEGDTIYVKMDMDPDGGDPPWASEVFLLLDDYAASGFEGVVTVDVESEAEVPL